MRKIINDGIGLNIFICFFIYIHNTIIIFLKKIRMGTEADTAYLVPLLMGLRPLQGLFSDYLSLMRGKPHI